MPEAEAAYANNARGKEVRAGCYLAIRPFSNALIPDSGSHMTQSASGSFAQVPSGSFLRGSDSTDALEK